MEGISERSLRIRHVLSSKAADPISWFNFSVPRLREAVALYADENPVTELLLRACNKGGKSLIQAAIVLACLQKRKTLDGVPLPQWTGRVEAAQLVLDYKVMVMSVQPAYERLLGTWPHKITRNGPYIESLRVQPVYGGDDVSKWSVVHFMSQKNMATGTGVRGDVIAFDEPPVPAILDELRKAAHAGRRSVRLIGMTPILRRQWAPIREQYGDPPRKSLTRPNPYWAECRWSLDEIAPWVLSDAEKDELRFNYSKMPSLAGAREHGDYCVTDGSCPFHVPTLAALKSECREPTLRPFRVQREHPDGLSLGEDFILQVEVWHGPEIGKTYWIVIDPASGTDDGHGHHDPLGLLVLERGTGNLVARYNGYVAPFSMGVLGAILARQYNDAVVDVESADRWGAGVFDGLTASRYGNLARERRLLRPGEWIEDKGFKNTAQTRPQIIAAVQAWVDARRAGVKYGNCPSIKLLECLEDCILDENGKIVGAPGVHDEDLILWGEGLRRTVSLVGRSIPPTQPAELTPDQVMIARIQGKIPQRQLPAPIGKARKAPTV